MHGTGQVLTSFYFFAPDGSPSTDSFGLGNWTGLGVSLASRHLNVRRASAGRESG